VYFILIGTLAKLSSSMLLLIKPRKVIKGFYLHGLPHVADPSEEIQEVLIACVEWNMENRAKDIPEADLPPCSRNL
jgi:hypothetical protein